MNNTYLVQRLNAPPKSDMHDKIEHAFGGASMINMGPEGFKLLRDVFSFDYMGAAEYEFGTVPKVLSAVVADSTRLVATTITIQAANIEPNWKRKYPTHTTKGEPKKKKQPKRPTITDKVVYVLCRKEHLPEVEARINLLAGGKIRTKMGTAFPNSLDPLDEHDGRAMGWLELDNGFFFFLDRTMWRKTATLFTGTDPAPEAP